MNIDEIRRLVSRGESETVEFKESFNDDALIAIGAFANARGGVILIGVKDSGAIRGVQLGKKTLEDIANRIREATDPRIQPSITSCEIDGKDVIIIDVFKSIGVPVSVRGRFYKRIGKTKQQMSHEEIIQSIASSSGLSWDAEVEQNATFNNIDLSLVEDFVDRVNRLGRRSIPPKAKPEEILRKLQLIKDGLPTRAALLLFGKTPDLYFPQAFLKMGRFRTPTIIIDDREIHGTLIQQVEGAMNWFRERLETEFVISGKSERDVNWEYPLDAIREGVINALSHRDFMSGAHNQIRLYDDRLEIWNAGSLPTQLTPENLFEEHDSIPRNRKISEIFYYIGFIERWGSGTLRIVEELETAQLPRPEFVSEGGRFKLIFHKSDLSQKMLQSKGLSERQLQAVAYVKEHGSISNSEYQNLAGVSKRTASRELNDLKGKNILFSEGGTGRGTLYRLLGSEKGPKGS